MNIILISKTRKLTAAFGDQAVRLLPPAEVADGLKAAAATICYLDRDAFSQKSFDETLVLAAGRKKSAWAVIDAGAKVQDPGALIHAGAVDYVSAAALARGVTAARLEQAADLFQARQLAASATQAAKAAGKARAAAATAAAAIPAVPDFPGWTRLQTGREYEFAFLFAELPDGEQIRKTFGERRFLKLKEDFVKSLNGHIMHIEGLSWMSDGQSLLALLPPHQCQPAVMLCLELLLGRTLFMYEQLGLNSATSLRFALHYGRTNWQKPGYTGHIISESVNYIHHLAHKFTPKNQLCLSGAVYDRLTPELRALLKPKGEFENTQVFCALKILNHL
jgi:hypothetical protein